MNYVFESAMKSQSQLVGFPQEVMSWIDLKNRTTVLKANDYLKVRPGLVYSISYGVVRFECDDPQKIIGFSDSCFEVPEGVKVYAQVETRVSWNYWTDLNPEEDLLVRQMICQEFLWTLSYIKVLRGSSADMAHAFLLHLGVRFGKLTQDGYYEIPWSFPQSAVAAAINTTRVTVTRMFNTMKQTGILRMTEDSKIQIAP